MTGAREYARLFPSGQYGKLRIESGEHARGKYFHIYIGQPDHEVEVFGILGGHPGWTEYYGWKKEGPWQLDFDKEIEKRRKILTAEIEANRKYKAITEQEQENRIKRVIEAY